MKRIIVMLLALMTVVALFTGCGNKDMFDTVYTFDEAILRLPDGTVISGEVQSWKDYEGDQLQIKIDGVTDLVHSSQVVLIAK